MPGILLKRMSTMADRSLDPRNIMCRFKHTEQSGYHCLPVNSMNRLLLMNPTPAECCAYFAAYCRSRHTMEAHYYPVTLTYLLMLHVGLFLLYILAHSTLPI